jgi:hypothetical protein
LAIDDRLSSTLVLETPHVVVGAAIATKVVHPALAIPLAFGSHFILEMVPHWNPHLNQEVKKLGKPSKQSTWIVAFDVATSLTLGGYIAYRQLPNTTFFLTILAASFFSVLPDLIEGPYFFLKMRSSKFVKKWISFQKSIQSDTNIFLGLSTQLLIIIASFLWIFS